jgi:hypothetical protein
MSAQSITRAIATLAIIAGPVAAQTALGVYTPTAAKYRITAVQNTSQIMMGQTQEFEATTNELVSLAIVKSASALTLTLTIDSATISSNAPAGVPNASEAIGLKFVGDMALDGKVGTSQITDKSGAPSTSQFATNLRTLLPRLRVGAVKGDSWLDSTTALIKQAEADINTESVVTYTLAGDTVLAGVKAWKVTGVVVTKLSGRGSQQGTDFTISGTSKGTITAVVSAAGVLLSESNDADANLSVNVEAANMTIPIVQHGTVKVEKLP